MGRDTLAVATGIAVLVTGVLAAVALSREADAVGAEGSDPPVTEPIPVAAGPVVELPGIDPAVARVLQWSGYAAPASAEDMALLPRSVAGLLIEYGVPLRVPLTSRRTS